jgi:hypothetical protein
MNPNSLYIFSVSLIILRKGKGKVHPITGHQGPRGGIEALEWGAWSASRPGRFTPRKDPVPIVQEAGWAPGLVWKCEKSRSH